MKLKCLVSVVFACSLITTSYAQINKGTTWVGSSFSYYKVNYDFEYIPPTNDYKSRATIVQPAWGVAIKENLVVGIFGNYQKTYGGHENIYSKDTRLGGGVFMRRYLPVINRFYIFGEGRLGYSSYEIRDQWETATAGTYFQEAKGWSTGLTLTPGISYGVTQSLQLEAGFSSLFNAWYGQGKSTYNNSPSEKSKSFSINTDLDNLSAFTIGFRLLLNKKA